MKIQKFDQEKLEQASKYLSSDALFIFVCNALARRSALSTVRMGDGERALIEYANGRGVANFLRNKEWLVEYGLLGADLQKIGNDLKEAAICTDFLCPNISGLMLPKYEILHLLPPKDFFGEGLYAHTWLYMGRVVELMKYDGGIGVVCRNSAKVADRLFMKYGSQLLNMEHADYGSWQDYPRALEAIGKMKVHLILVSAGPSGKRLCVDAARKYGKVVLDTGSALIRHWSVAKTRDI